MKHKLQFSTYIGVLFLLTSLLFSSDNRAAFEKGNQLYREGSYRKAIDAYTGIVESGMVSSEVYYNLGNCYYKLAEIGRAVLSYERALRLAPGDEDVKANLAIAKLQTVDKIEKLPTFFLFDFTENIFHLLSSTALLRLTLLGYVVMVSALTAMVLFRGERTKLIFKRSAQISAGIFLVFALGFAGQRISDRSSSRAIILADKVDVLSAPGGEGAVQVFALHEGATVSVEEMSGMWAEIKLADGKVGWVKKEVFEEI